MLGFFKFVRVQKLPALAVAHTGPQSASEASAVGAPCWMDWSPRRRQHVSAAISELCHRRVELSVTIDACLRRAATTTTARHHLDGCRRVLLGSAWRALW